MVTFFSHSGCISEETKAELINVEFVLNTINTFLWLCASSVWAATVVYLKHDVDPANWIFQNKELNNNTICSRLSNGNYYYDHVKECTIDSAGYFYSADVAMSVGFVSLVIWLLQSLILCGQSTMVDNLYSRWRNYRNIEEGNDQNNSAANDRLSREM